MRRWRLAVTMHISSDVIVMKASLRALELSRAGSVRMSSMCFDSMILIAGPYLTLFESSETVVWRGSKMQLAREMAIQAFQCGMWTSRTAFGGPRSR